MKQHRAKQSHNGTDHFTNKDTSKRLTLFSNIKEKGISLKVL